MEHKWLVDNAINRIKAICMLSEFTFDRYETY